MSKATLQAKREAEREEAAQLTERYVNLVLSLEAAGKLPFSEAARAELAMTLKRDCESLEHAARAVRDAINIGAPPEGWTVQALRPHITNTRQERMSAYNPDCAECGGTGWRPVYVIITTERGTERKQFVSEREFNDAWRERKLNPLTQRAISAAARCSAGCQPRGTGFTVDNTR